MAIGFTPVQAYSNASQKKTHSVLSAEYNQQIILPDGAAAFVFHDNLKAGDTASLLPQNSCLGKGSDNAHIAQKSRMRWVVLALASTILFGNFFAYDQPAALNIPLRQSLKVSDADFEYFLATLYVVYSFPNIFLPLVGGVLIDRLGARRITLLFSFLVVFGEFVFVIGLISNSLFTAVLGRFIFGLGGETLSVAQQFITTKWFIGGELAMAGGVNLAVARFGSVVNDFISPRLAFRGSVALALWFGTASCVFSLFCTVVLLYVDSKYAPNSSSYSLTDLTDETFHLGSDGREQSLPLSPRSEASCDRDSLIDHTMGAPSEPSFSECSRISPVDISQQDALLSPKRQHTSAISKSGNHRVNQHRVPRVQRREMKYKIPSSTKVPQSLPLLVRGIVSDMILQLKHVYYDFKLFPAVFHWSQVWVVFQLGTTVPFNTIHAAFLAQKWYKGEPEYAAQVMGIPDTISAIFVPITGYFYDKWGYRGHSMIVCGVILSFVHFCLGLVPSSILVTPVGLLVLLGICYAMLLAYVPCIPLVIPRRSLGTAYGISTSVANFSWTVFPIIVSKFSASDPTYVTTETFFALCGIFSIFAALIVNYLDKKYHNSVLRKPQLQTAATSGSEFY